jgi:hypothetical protein
MDDARRVLQMAAEMRTPISLSTGDDRGVLAELVRVEPGGVVVDGGDNCFPTGTDWRGWFSFGGRSYRFTASVLELGAMLPNRTQSGVLLGYIDGWSSEQATTRSVTLTVFGPGGLPLPIGKDAARCVEASPKRLAFTLPADSPVAFVEGGTVQVEICLTEQAPIGLSACVVSRVETEGHALYALVIETVSDPQSWRSLLTTLEAADIL